MRPNGKPGAGAGRAIETTRWGSEAIVDGPLDGVAIQLAADGLVFPAAAELAVERPVAEDSLVRLDGDARRVQADDVERRAGERHRTAAADLDLDVIVGSFRTEEAASAELSRVRVAEQRIGRDVHAPRKQIVAVILRDRPGVDVGRTGELEPAIAAGKLEAVPDTLVQVGADAVLRIKVLVGRHAEVQVH